MNRFQLPERSELLAAVVAFALAVAEWYVVDRFFATPGWPGGTKLIVAVWLAGTSMFAGVVLVISVLVVHAKEHAAFMAFLWEGVTRHNTPWRRGMIAFVRFMAALALVMGGLGALNW